jgi:hypothetical protein
MLKELFKELPKHMMFYLAVQSASGIDWYQIITLRSGSTMNKLKFFGESKTIIEDYDLNGLTIHSISLDEAPYVTFKDCNAARRECSSSGYIIDYVDHMSKILNFTFEAHIDPDGDWGLLPKSGPTNRSVVWGGVMGGLVHGTYDVSLSIWLWIIHRLGHVSTHGLFKQKLNCLVTNY